MSDPAQDIITLWAWTREKLKEVKKGNSRTGFQETEVYKKPDRMLGGQLSRYGGSLAQAGSERRKEPKEGGAVTWLRHNAKWLDG